MRFSLIGDNARVKVIWWAHLESDQGPLSYQDSVLPLNYTPVGNILILCENKINL